MNFLQAKKIQTLYETLQSNHLPITIAYKLMQLNATAADCIKFAEMQYQKIVSEYALRDENGQYVATENGDIQILPDKIEEARRQMTELDEFEVTVSPSTFLTYDELSRLNENLELSMENLQILFPFVLNPTE